MPRAIEVREVPGVEDALATRDPVRCAREISEILGGGADRKEVARTVALAAARHFSPALPPPHGVLAMSAGLELSTKVADPKLPILQACALIASEWRDEPLAATPQSITGDELHLARSFAVAVRGADVREADAIFSGLLREGDERRLAGDALFELCAQDLAGEGHKLTFAVGSWRLARTLAWLRGSALLRPAVHLAAGTTQDLSSYSAALREVGRSRLDLELSGRNVAEVDAVARNTYAIAMGAGPDRVVADLIAGLKRGRRPAGYADLVAASAAERLVGNPEALEAALFALAVRFVLGFSRTSTHVLAVLQAGRMVASLRATDPLSPARIGDADEAMRELVLAIDASDARRAASLALALADALEPETVSRSLQDQAALQDAVPDAGHRLLYAAWASEFAKVAAGPALASLAAVLARAPKSHSVADALTSS